MDSKDRSVWRSKSALVSAGIAVTIITLTVITSYKFNVRNREIISTNEISIFYLANIRIQGEPPDPWSSGHETNKPRAITCNGDSDGVDEHPVGCTLASHPAWFNKSDVVLFNAIRLMPTKKYTKLPGQIWGVYLNQASLPNLKSYPRAIKNHADQFNFVSTYHERSHVPLSTIPWTDCQSNPRDLLNMTSSRNYIRGKTKLAAHVMDKCITDSKRELYVQELGKHMQLDVMGGCDYLIKICHHSDFHCIKSVLERTYKFALVLEPTICQDYTSKSLVHMFGINVVPVVMGSTNYTKRLPPGTYIDVHDFDSPGKLANHLRIVAANATLYNRLIENRQRAYCPPRRSYLCRLCRFLKKNRNMATLGAVDQTWNSNLCTSRKTFYERIGVNIT